ncbi:MAG: WGR domain-containing protein [Deltaproteobacteria bacterium]|nr:WGR domain-containing protein [Deltaproteobacteria bacterium]
MARRHHFHSVDPSKNRARFYRITECQTLFGERVLRVEYGRIGTNMLKARDEVFTDDFARALRFDELVRLRKSHGYSLVQAA